LTAGLRRPLRIGDLALETRLFMAPLAGLTTPPFRRSVRRWGAGLVHSEMISACGIHYGNRRTAEYVRCGTDEHPIGFQLFGADPSIMAEAAGVCLEAGADLIDINMACPVRKVLKTGAGAALLDDRAQAVDIAAAVVDAVGGVAPVTVKLRTGVRAGDPTVFDLAPRLVGAGVSALTLHARSANQLYRGTADHALTSRLAALVDVPVVASGDIVDGDACARVLAGGAAAVMVARAALGRPWVFSELLDEAPPPPVERRLEELRRFVAEVVADRGERSVGYLRQLWPRFRRSGTLTRTQAEELMQAGTVAEVRSRLARMHGASG
jgi:tRNA-dihydrouridine synthase B